VINENETYIYMFRFHLSQFTNKFISTLLTKCYNKIK
jgi:hypothetical protein